MCQHQAQGRVERVNATLQDRLVKEMRRRGIANRAAGNGYAPQFIAAFNRRFAVPPREAENAHRPRLPQDDLRGSGQSKNRAYYPKT